MKQMITVRSIAWGIVAGISSCIKLTPIIGSYHAWFSTTALIFSITGISAGPHVCIAYIIFKLISSAFKTNFLSAFLHILGGISANLAWIDNKYIDIGLIASCFFLFLIHPVGYQVPLYTLYWLIPFILLLLPVKNFFLDAFRVTWIAHAVGSIVWLYGNTIEIATWHFLSMNPIVICERIMMALGMILCYALIIAIENSLCWIQKKYLYRWIKALA